MEELKVLIIDDEIMALEYLRELITWEAFGYQIVAETTDANHALRQFQAYRPQIIISDICMPGMSGLEFCEQVLSIDKSVKIILLTAYKEFEYAKKAIELGVSNYILKHELSDKTLLSELEKVASELKNERSSSNIIKKHLLMNLMEDNDYMQQLDLKPQWEFLNKGGGMFILVILKKDEPYPIVESTTVMHSPEMREEWKHLDEGSTDEFVMIDSIKLRNQMWAVLFTCSRLSSESAVWNRFYPIAVKTQSFFSEASGSTYSAAIEMERQEIKNIPKMYKSCLKTLEYTPFFTRSKILRRMDIPNVEAHRYALETEQALNMISSALEGQNVGQLDAEMERLFRDCIAPSFDTTLLRKCSDELVRIINKWREKNFLASIPHESAEVFAGLHHCYTLTEMMKALIHVYKMSIEDVMDLHYNKYPIKIQKAIKYLHIHYPEDISIVDVAEAVEISASNLSRAFRKETGQSFLDYLTAIRIEEAQKLLLTSDLKIYQISEKVGYKTSQYFSQVFLKVTGMQPLDFRGGGKHVF